MTYLYIVLLFALITLVYMRIEAAYLEVTHVKFTDGKNYIKAIQLSDIHIGRLLISHKKVRHILEMEKPDLIIISGDLIEHSKQIDKFVKFANSITGICPIYSCLGNHDYEAFKGDDTGLQRFINTVEATGINVLINSSVKFEKGNKIYNIIGIGDCRYNKHDLDKAFQNCNNTGSVNIGFSHNPDIALQIPQNKLSYLFCGHFHGGQIWMPFDIEYKLLRGDKLCKMGIRRGLHQFNGINLYINRGLGNVLFPLRLFSRPEITVFHIK